jgi:hypothetical protein
MFSMMLATVFFLITAPFVYSQTYKPPCSVTQGEFSFDFSSFEGKRFITQGKDPKGNEYVYHFAPCDTIADAGVECIMDPGGVITGMVIQRSQDDSCFVLGQFDSSITPSNWDLYKSSGVVHGATLSTDNGSPTSCSGGVVRTLDVNFVCGAEVTPPDNSWEVLNEQGCDYTINFPTKLACTKGQTPVAPHVNPNNNNNNKGPSFGTAVMIILGISILLYFGLGTIFNLSQGKTGMEAVPTYIFCIFTLASEGSVYFFTNLQSCIIPSNRSRNLVNGNEKFNSVHTPSNGNDISYNKQEYDEIGEDYVTDF